MNDNAQKSILVTGATGYVGGRLVPRLLQANYPVRVLVRGSAARLEGRSWKNQVEIVVGDVLEPVALAEAMSDIDAAYYLVRRMVGRSDICERNVRAATNFAKCAAEAGVEDIIFLGGLGDTDREPSEFLRSRRQTGDTLRQFDIPVTEFHAGMVVGCGSLTFEMIRNLTERLPIMVAPRWVYTRSQPIAVRDVLNYLISTLKTPASRGKIIEIGGPDILTYADMMMTYARIRGLRRMIIRVPVLTPRLSSYWVHWITPVSSNAVIPLIEGLRSQLIVHDQLAKSLFPDIEPTGFETALRGALERTEHGEIETLWSDAFASSLGDIKPVNLSEEHGMLLERRHKRVDAKPAAVFRAFCSLGGERGWPPYNWLWQVRGALDRLVGGVGIRRGRRHPDDLRPGEALDFWRVERVERDHLLRLRAEMKMPGEGWLQFEANCRNDGRTDLIQTAYFASKGISGLLYWYSLYPLHGLIFSRMIGAIAQRAIEYSRSSFPNPAKTPSR